MMWSVEMSSPSFSSTDTAIASGKASSSAKVAISGVFSSHASRASSGDSGGTSMASFVIQRSGRAIFRETVENLGGRTKTAQNLGTSYRWSRRSGWVRSDCGSSRHRLDGSRRLTSVTKHTEFVRSRTRHSDTLAGRVKFNECVRLLKWWRFIRIDAASAIDEVRTTLIELLCASAYDKLGVEATYTETLLKWFADRTRGLAVDHARLLLRLLDPLHRVDDPFDATTIHQPSTES